MAAEDLKTKKRKGASDAAPKPKKQKKIEETATVAPAKSSKTSKKAAEPTDPPAVTVKVKPARKRAAELLDNDEAPVETDAVPAKKSKKKGKTVPADDTTDAAAVVVEVTEKPKKKAKKNKEPEVEAAVEVVAEAPKVKAKKGKKAKQPEDAPAPAVEVEAVDPEEVAVTVDVKKPKKAKKSKKQEEAPVEDAPKPTEEDDEDLDDQTAALLAGFDSDRDESDLEKEDEAIDENDVPKLTKKQRKAIDNVRKNSEPGVVYLGRIPHGFFEPQMKKYFAQFGDIKRLRLSRNKKTGASKHYAFIEFRHGEVADIVAQAMNNYLMFGHILQCRVIPSEQVHEELFKGSNERFKVDPRNKKAGNEMKRGATRVAWEKRVENENKKRKAQAKELEEEFGYTFAAPAVKTVSAVPKKTLDIEDAAEQQLLDEAPPAEVSEVAQVTESTPDHLTVTETVKVKKTKKAAKGKAEPEVETTAVTEVETVPAPKVKKEKKRKSDVLAEQVEEPVTPKAKKASKREVTSDTKPKPKVADKDGAKANKAKRHSTG